VDDEVDSSNMYKIRVDRALCAEGAENAQNDVHEVRDNGWTVYIPMCATNGSWKCAQFRRSIIWAIKASLCNQIIKQITEFGFSK
jgi:hypothetical protein